MHAPAVLPGVDKVPSAHNRADQTDDGAGAAAAGAGAGAPVGVNASQQTSAPSLWQRRIAARGAPAAGSEPAPLAPLASLNIPSDTATSTPGIPSPGHSASRSALPSPLPFSRPDHTPLYSAEPKPATNVNHSDSLSWDWISSAQGPGLWAPPCSAGLGPSEPRPFNASSPATDLHKQGSGSLSASVSHSPPIGYRVTPSPLPTPERKLEYLPGIAGSSGGGTTTQAWSQQPSSLNFSSPPLGSSDRLWYQTTGVGDRQGMARFPLRTAPPTATAHPFASPGVNLGVDDMRKPASAVPPMFGAPRTAQLNRSQSSHVATQVALSALSIDDDDGYSTQAQTQSQPNSIWGLPPGQLARGQEASGPSGYSDSLSHLGGQYDEHETYEPRGTEGEYDFGCTGPLNELGSNSSYGPNGEDRSRRKGRARMSQEKRRRLARRREREREAAQAGTGANLMPGYPSGGSRSSMTSSSNASYLSGASLLSRPSSLNLSTSGPGVTGPGVNSLPPHPSTTWAQAHANEATSDTYYGGRGSLRPNQLGLDTSNLGPNPVSSGPTGSTNNPGYASGSGLGYTSSGPIPTPHNRPVPLPPHTATGWNRTSGPSNQQYPHHNGPHTSSSPHPNYQPDPTAPPRSAPAHISSFTLPPVPVPLPPQHGPRTTRTPPSRQMPLPTGPASRSAQSNPRDNWGGRPASLGGLSSGPGMTNHAIPPHSAIPLSMNQAQRFPSSSPISGGPQALDWRSSSHNTTPHVPPPRSHQTSPARSFSSPNAAAAAAAASSTSGHTPFYYARPENQQHGSEQPGSGSYLPAYRSHSRPRAPASPHPAGTSAQPQPDLQPRAPRSRSHSGHQSYSQGSASSWNGMSWNVQSPSQSGPPQSGSEAHNPVEQALAAGYAAGLAAGQRALAARRVYE